MHRVILGSVVTQLGFSLDLTLSREPETFHTETLCVVETDRDDRIAAHVMFGTDDIDAAFVELDARCLGGAVERP